MADDTKRSTALIEWFGQVVDERIEGQPDQARALLLAAFKGERLRCRYLPHKQLLPSGQIDNYLALDGVVRALERPEESIITSLFMPSEIFMAMGLRPMIAEAFASFCSGAQAEQGFVDAAERRGIPETYCSYHKVLVGAAAAGVIAAPRMIANCSVACDANSLTFRFLAQRLGVPQAFIDVPYEPSEEAVAYVADELREMLQLVEDTFARKLDETELKRYVARGQAQLEAQWATLARKAGRAQHTTMTIEMMRMMATHMLLGSEQVDALMEQAMRDHAATESYAGLNLVWAHSMPYFSVPLQRALDLSERAQIVASEMCFDQHRAEGWVHGADEPFEAMAERLVYNSFNGSAERRVARVLEIAETTQADGIVVFCHWGCKETLGAAQLMRRTFEQAGYPTLVLDGDGCARRNMSEGQTATRVEAYLEMLEHEKRASEEACG